MNTEPNNQNSSSDDATPLASKAMFAIVCTLLYSHGMFTFLSAMENMNDALLWVVTLLTAILTFYISFTINKSEDRALMLLCSVFFWAGGWGFSIMMNLSSWL